MNGLFELLHDFSENLPSNLEGNLLWTELEENCKKLRFPRVQNDVGQILSFFTSLLKPKKVFEFGSGYGHSAFWYFQNKSFYPNQVVLTERRKDLKSVFEKIHWSEDMKSSLLYFQGDAWDIIGDHLDSDLLLLDGEKADYQKWLEYFEDKLNPNALILIDNSFWKGSFLNQSSSQTNRSTAAIKNLHVYLKNSLYWEHTFLPVRDGLSIVRKRERLF